MHLLACCSSRSYAYHTFDLITSFVRAGYVHETRNTYISIGMMAARRIRLVKNVFVIYIELWYPLHGTVTAKRIVVHLEKHMKFL